MAASPTPSLEHLLRQHDWLRRLAASLAIDAAHADDLAQRALMVALERPAVEVGHARAWLATIVRRLARRDSIDAERRTARERRSASPESQPPTDEVVARATLQSEVATTLLALEEPYRTALLLRFFDDLKPGAIARRLGCPVETVRTRIKRGLESMRERLVARRAPRSDGVRRTGELGVALVGLIDPGLRRVVRRAVLAKAPALVVVTTGVGWMSWKLTAACLAIVAAAGAAMLLERGGDGAAAVREVARDRVAPASAGATQSSPSNAPATALPPESAAANPTREAEPTAAGRPSTPAPTTSVAPPASSGDVLVGTVRDGSGEPVAGAWVAVAVRGDRPSFSSLVEVARHPEWFTGPGDRPDGKRVETAEDGTFHVAGLAPGATVDVGVVERAKGLAHANGLLLEETHLPLHVDLALERGCVVRGLVRDPAGAPVARAKISLTGEQERSTWGICHVTADEAGSYRSLPLPFRRFVVSASADGFISEGFEARPERDEDDEVAVDVTLTPVFRMVGRVLSRDGGSACLAQFPGALRLVGSSQDPAKVLEGVDFYAVEVRGAVVRETDRYELDYSDHALRFVSLWRGDELLGAAGIDDPARAPDLLVDVSARTPPTRGTIELEVVDGRAATAIDSFRVELRPLAAGILGLESSKRSVGVVGGAGPHAIQDLEPVDYDVVVRAAGFAARSTVAHLSANRPLAHLRVELLPATTSLRGRVVGPDAQPITNAILHLCALDGEVALPGELRASGASGTFAFDAVPEGRWLVVATADGYAPTVAAARGGEVALEIALERGVVPRFSIVRDGAPFQGTYDYRIRDANGVVVAGFELLDVNGGPERPMRLRPGDYTLEVFARFHRTPPVRFTAAADAVVPVELVPVSAGASGR
jgi:RNA polymerase sigma-70 factor (ECF subfamily)